MTMNWNHLLAVSSLNLMCAVLSAVSNTPEKDRHRQFLTAVFALIYALAAVAGCSFYSREIRQGISAVLGWLRIAMDPPAFPVYLNLIVLLFFVLLKIFFTGTRNRKGASGTVVPPPGYEKNLDGEIVLKKDFRFTGELFLLLSAAAFLLILFCAATLFGGLGVPVPFLPAVPFILLSEWGWYLGGDLGSQALLDSGESVTVAGAFSDMWEFCRNLWGDKLLAACRSSENRGNERTGLARETLKKIGEQLGDPGKTSHILIEGASFHTVFPDLARCFWDHLVSGSRILVLLGHLENRGEVTKALSLIFSSASLDMGQWVTEDMDSHKLKAAVPDILLATPRFLLDPRYRPEPWHEDIRLVFIPDLPSLIPSVQRVDTLLKILKDIGTEARVVVLSDVRERASVSFRNSFSAGDLERFALENVRPERQETMIWKTEAEPWFQNKVLKREYKFLGVEPMLSFISWIYRVMPVRQFGQAAAPWKQRTDLLQKAMNLDYFADFLSEAFKRAPEKRCRLEETAGDVFHIQPLSWFRPKTGSACVVVRDHRRNLTSALYNHRTQADPSVFIHVVCPPYLLRDYMAGNIEFFESQPVMPFMPVLSRTPCAMAVQLVRRLVHSMMDGFQLLRILRECDETLDDPFKGLVRVLEQNLGLERVERRNLVKRSGVMHRYLGDENRFEEYECFGLMPEILDDKRLRWLESFDLTGTCENETFSLGTVSLDHLYQRFLPDQIHGFRGDAYLVSRVDENTKKVELAYREGAVDSFYHPDVEIRIHSLSPPLTTNRAYGKDLEIYDARLRADFCDASFTVVTHGFFAFDRGIDLEDARTNYVECDAVPDRYYSHGRFLKLVFGAEGIGATARVAMTLSHLMNEMFRTFLPESFMFVHAGTVVKDRERFMGHANLCRYIPSFSVQPDVADPGHSGALDLLEEDCEGKITVVLVEDSHQDLGICGLFFDEIHLLRLFEFMYDTLKWMTCENAENGKSLWEKRIGGKEQYLYYGGERIPAVFDIPGTIRFLECLGFGDDEDTVHHHRTAFYKGKYTGDDFAVTPGTATTRIRSDRTTEEKSSRVRGVHQCDFCGKSVPAAEMTLIDKTLERCPECSASAVESFADLERLYREARNFLEIDMGVSIREGITVEFAHTRRIQEEAGTPFVPTTGMDPRSVGVATIMIENGAPSHAILGTLVHELTHIWQYDNLDMERMKKEKGLVYTEGHAKWTELECLGRKGLAVERCAAEKKRKDVYGQGYRAMVRMLAGNPSFRSPFGLLLERYGSADNGRSRKRSEI
jgi:hypothetical protein